jgi:calcineurin-like phosphoesterase family protein
MKKGMKKIVKVLCVADEVDLLVYSSSIRDRFGDVDLILSAGDLPAEYLGFITDMLNKPIVSVAGNHDPDDGPGWRSQVFQYSMYGDMNGADASLPGNLFFGIREEAGVSVLGLPGSKRYNNGANQYSDTWMTWKLLRMLPRLLFRRLIRGRSVDIILAHAPPKDIQDGPDLPHQGFSAYRWLIKLCKPVYFVHGHVHLYDAQVQRSAGVDNTQVINVFGHQVITLEVEEKN